MQKLNLTPWQLVFVKILVDENPRTVYANNLRFQDIIFNTYKTGHKYAKEIGNTKLARTYAKLNNEMRDIVIEQIDDLIEREIIVDHNPKGEKKHENYEINPRYVPKFSIAVMGMPSQLHDAYPHHFGEKKFPAKSCSEQEIAVDYLRNIGNSEEEHLRVLEDVRWAKENNQITMGLVKFVQSKNWMAIREQREKGFLASPSNFVASNSTLM